MGKTTAKKASKSAKKVVPVEETPTHRDRILTAASDAFLEKGFEQTSTADIARRAKVSKRELYALCRDKRALLAAVVVDLQSSMQSRMGSEWSSTEKPEVVLPNAAAAILDFILSERFGKLFRIVAAESYMSPEVAEEFYALGPHRGVKATAAYLRAQMNRGELRKDDAMRAADQFLDLVVGAQLMTAVILGQVDPAFPRKSHVRHAVAAFLRIYGV